jgi:hypothetical protein
MSCTLKIFRFRSSTRGLPECWSALATIFVALLLRDLIRRLTRVAEKAAEAMEPSELIYFKLYKSQLPAIETLICFFPFLRTPRGGNVLIACW